MTTCSSSGAGTRAIEPALLPPLQQRLRDVVAVARPTLVGAAGLIRFPRSSKMRPIRSASEPTTTPTPLVLRQTRLHRLKQVMREIGSCSPG